MINREDMLELTRRMTLKRNTIDRMAGCYRDKDGDFDGSFNTHFLKLSLTDRNKNLSIAKKIPFAQTNVELKEYSFSPEVQRPGSTWHLLSVLKECGLKNDALMDVLYDEIEEVYHPGKEYAFYLFHGRYDIPVKGKDGERQWESEEVYEYMIGAVCPLVGEYEPGQPEWGFLFPMFSDRSSNDGKIALFFGDQMKNHSEIISYFLNLS